MKYEQVEINKLIPYKNNARTHSDEQIKQIQASIREFGFINPVLIDKDLGIIAGHGRVMAAKNEGMEKVPCIFIEHLTEAQQKAYIIADNKLAENAGWDTEKLKIELTELQDLDFNLELTGFADMEIDELLFEEADEAKEDDFEIVLPANPKSKLGDIYQLGRHRLMCGDSTTDDVDKLMNGNKADMVFTDPPYGINYSGGRVGGDAKPAHGQIKNDDLKGLDLGNLISRVFTNNKSEADVYICVSPIMQKSFLIALGDKKLDAVIVWDKRNPGLGYMAYRRQCEFIYFIKGAPFRKGDKSDFDLWSISKGDTSAYVHGTQKPIAVPARAIENSSKKDDSILDLFGGSGSTLIACEQLDRICYMMELDEKYVDVIIDRWEQFTGEKAVLLNE